jgi:hydrogenase maturation factor
MCLTIPKKVVEIKENTVVVELPNKTRQEVKSIVELNVGDFCLTQQNVAIEKIDKEAVSDLINIFAKKENVQ